MASWQAKLFSTLSKQTAKRRPKGERNVGRLRTLLAPKPSPLPPGVRATPDEVGGVSGEWCESDDASHGLLLYIHGDWFIDGSGETHRSIPAYFAKLGFRVFAPDYRLAPEYPFPAAIHDLIAVYLAMAENNDPPTPVAIAGQSAGGNLAVALMLALRDAARSLPKAAVLFSPWTDLACTGASHRTNAAHCSVFHASDLPFAAAGYLGGASPRDPLASPFYADLSKLPPISIHVGENEILLDDSTRFAANARKDGVKVDLKVWPVVPHGWQILTAKLPEARESIEEAASFLA